MDYSADFRANLSISVDKAIKQTQLMAADLRRQMTEVATSIRNTNDEWARNRLESTKALADITKAVKENSDALKTALKDQVELERQKKQVLQDADRTIKAALKTEADGLKELVVERKRVLAEYKAALKERTDADREATTKSTAALKDYHAQWKQVVTEQKQGEKELAKVREDSATTSTQATDKHTKSLREAELAYGKMAAVINRDVVKAKKDEAHYESLVEQRSIELAAAKDRVADVTARLSKASKEDLAMIRIIEDAYRKGKTTLEELTKAYEFLGDGADRNMARVIQKERELKETTEALSKARETISEADERRAENFSVRLAARARAELEFNEQKKRALAELSIAETAYLNKKIALEARENSALKGIENEERERARALLENEEKVRAARARAESTLSHIAAQEKLLGNERLDTIRRVDAAYSKLEDSMSSAMDSNTNEIRKLRDAEERLDAERREASARVLRQQEEHLNKLQEERREYDRLRNSIADVSQAQSQLRARGFAGLTGAIGPVKSLLGVFQSLGYVVSGVGMALGSLGNVVQGIGSAFGQAIQTTATLSTHLTEMMTVTQLSAKEASALQVILETTGGSTYAFNAGLNTMITNAGKHHEAFKLLGVSVVDSNNKLKAAGQIFYELADAVNKAENKTAAFAATNQIFSPFFAKSINEVLKLGSERLKEIANDLDKFGLVMNEQMLAKGVAARNAMLLWQRAIQMVQVTIITALLPAIVSFVSFVITNLPKIEAAFRRLGEVISGLATGIFGALGLDFNTKLKGTISTMTALNTEGSEAVGTSGELKDAQDDLRLALNDATTALHAQERALQDEERALQANMQAIKDYYDDLIRLKEDTARDLGRTINQLERDMAGATKGPRAELEGLQTDAAAVNRELTALRRELSGLVKDQEEVIRLAREHLDNIKDMRDAALKPHQDELASVKDFIETLRLQEQAVLDDIASGVDKIREAIEELRDAEEAALAPLQAMLDAIELRAEAIQDELEALQEQWDAEDEAADSAEDSFARPSGSARPSDNWSSGYGVNVPPPAFGPLEAAQEIETILNKLREITEENEEQRDFATEIARTNEEIASAQQRLSVAQQALTRNYAEELRHLEESTDLYRRELDILTQQEQIQTKITQQKQHQLQLEDMLGISELGRLQAERDSLNDSNELRRRVGESRTEFAKRMRLREIDEQIKQIQQERRLEELRTQTERDEQQERNAGLRAELEEKIRLNEEAAQQIKAAQTDALNAEKEIKSEITSLQRELNTLVRDQARAEAELLRAQQEAAKEKEQIVAEEIQSSQEASQQLTDDAKKLQDETKKMREASKKQHQSMLKELRKQSKEIKRQMDAIKKSYQTRIKAMEQDIKGQEILARQVRRTWGAAIRAAEAHGNQLQNTINTITNQYLPLITRMENEIKTQEGRLRQIQTDYEPRIAALETRAENIRLDIEKKQEEIKGIEEQYKPLIEAKRAEIDLLRDEIDDLRYARENELRPLEQTLRNVQTRLQDLRQEAQAHRDAWTNATDDIKKALQQLPGQAEEVQKKLLDIFRGAGPSAQPSVMGEGPEATADPAMFSGEVENRWEQLGRDVVHFFQKGFTSKEAYEIWRNIGIAIGKAIIEGMIFAIKYEANALRDSVGNAISGSPLGQGYQTATGLDPRNLQRPGNIFDRLRERMRNIGSPMNMDTSGDLSPDLAALERSLNSRSGSGGSEDITARFPAGAGEEGGIFAAMIASDALSVLEGPTSVALQSTYEEVGKLLYDSIIKGFLTAAKASNADLKNAIEKVFDDIFTTKKGSDGKPQASIIRTWWEDLKKFLDEEVKPWSGKTVENWNEFADALGMSAEEAQAQNKAVGMFPRLKKMITDWWGAESNDGVKHEMESWEPWNQKVEENWNKLYTGLRDLFDRLRGEKGGDGLKQWLASMLDAIKAAGDNVWAQFQPGMEETWKNFKATIGFIVALVNGLASKLLAEGTLIDLTGEMAPITPPAHLQSGGGGSESFAARGGIFGATPGGRVRITEAGEDEAVIPLGQQHRREAMSLMHHVGRQFGVGGPGEDGSVQVPDLTETDLAHDADGGGDPGNQPWEHGLGRFGRLPKVDELRAYVQMFYKRLAGTDFATRLTREFRDTDDLDIARTVWDEDGDRLRGSFAINPPAGGALESARKAASEKESILGLLQIQNWVRALREIGGTMSWPVMGPITQRFGESAIQYAAGYHTGIDIDVPTGTPLRAPASGVVTNIVNYPAGESYGLMMAMRHNEALSSIFGHLLSTNANVGEVVRQGQVIAATDNTGRSTGPHLHWETLMNGQPMDPLKVLGRFMGIEGGRTSITNPLEAAKDYAARVPANIKALIAGHMGEYGWNNDELLYALAVAGIESNGTVNARNPESTASGIFQLIDSNWGLMPGGASGLGNANAEVVGGLNYIARRYGTPTEAWMHEVEHGWYDQGGIGGLDGPERAFLGGRGPELVLDADTTRELARAGLVKMRRGSLTDVAPDLARLGQVGAGDGQGARSSDSHRGDIFNTNVSANVTFSPAQRTRAQEEAHVEQVLTRVLTRGGYRG